MTTTKIEGKIIFVQYEKKFVTVEYVQNGKTKTLNGSIKEMHLEGNTQSHYFREGDEIVFVPELSSRGDKMMAAKIEFRFNNSLNVLLNKAATDNRFTGYLKQVEDTYFIKEVDSYQFFPVTFSRWELPPPSSEINEAIHFKLENFSNPEKVKASLLHPKLIPAYKKAQYYYENKKAIEVPVNKITPHGIYLDVIGVDIQGKLDSKKFDENEIPQPGEKVKIIITYLSPEQIVIEKQEANNQ